MESINRLILILERKFPVLWDKDFLSSLPVQTKAEPTTAPTTEQKIYQHDIFKERFHELLLE